MELDFEKLKTERETLIDKYTEYIKKIKEFDTRLGDFHNTARKTEVTACKLQLALLERKTKFCTKQQKKRDRLEMAFARKREAMKNRADKKAFYHSLKFPRVENPAVNPPVGDNPVSAGMTSKNDTTQPVLPKPAPSRKVLPKTSLKEFAERGEI